MTATPARRPGRPWKLRALQDAPPAMPLRTAAHTLAVLLEAEIEARQAALAADQRHLDRLREQVAQLRETAAAPVPTAPAEAYLTLSQAAERLAIGPKQLRRWVKQGGLPVLRDPVTGAARQPYRIREADLQALFAAADR